MSAEPGEASAGGVRYRLAAGTYAVYGVLYWIGGLALFLLGLGPQVVARSYLMWFTLGALLVGLVPWLLVRRREGFERWVLSRRDFARILALFVAFRAFEVGRLLPNMGLPFAVAGGAFCIVTVATALILARAAWSCE